MIAAPFVALAMAVAASTAEPPAGLWAPAQAERVEAAIDAWFRAEVPERAAARLRACGEALGAGELAAMPETAPTAATAIDGLPRAWRVGDDDDDPRGACIVALPEGYRRERAWPLAIVVADDGEAAARELAPALTRAGCIAIVAQTAPGGPPDRATIGRVLRLAAWSARTWRVDCRRLALVLGGAARGALAEHVRLGGDVWSAIVARGGGAAGALAPTDAKLAIAGEALPDDAAAIAAWLAAQPSAPWSPRPTLLPRAPRRAPADEIADPLGRLAPAAPAGAAEDALACWRHALATLPALSAGFVADAADQRRAGAERTALADLSRAIRLLNQATPAARERAAALADEVYVAAAKLHARRFLALVDGGGQAWVKPYRDAVACVRAALAIDPSDGRALDIARAIGDRFPRELLTAEVAR